MKDTQNDIANGVLIMTIGHTRTLHLIAHMLDKYTSWKENQNNV